MMKGILATCKELALLHPTVNGTGVGDVFQLNSAKRIKYPLLWFDMPESELDGNDINQRLTIYYIDRLKDDQTDEVEIVQDSAAVIHDFLKRLSEYYSVSFPVTVTYFKQRLTDICAGGQCDVRVLECPQTVGIREPIVAIEPHKLPSNYVGNSSEVQGQNLTQALNWLKNNSGGIAEVVTDATIEGDGTTLNPLSIHPSINYLLALIRQLAPELTIDTVTASWDEELVVVVTTSGGLEPITTIWALDGTMLTVTTSDAVGQQDENIIDLSNEYPITINSVDVEWDNGLIVTVNATGGFGEYIVTFTQDGATLIITVKDQIGIEATTIADLDTISPIAISILTSETTGENEAIITCVASGGFGDLLYSLYFDDTFIESNTTGIFTVTLEGTYSVVVSDEGGATPDSDLIEIQLVQPIPAPDFLFDTRTGLVISDSVAGEQLDIKDFPVQNFKTTAGAAFAVIQVTNEAPITTSGDYSYVYIARNEKSDTVDSRGYFSNINGNNKGTTNINFRNRLIFGGTVIATFSTPLGNNNFQRDLTQAEPWVFIINFNSATNTVNCYLNGTLIDTGGDSTWAIQGSGQMTWRATQNYTDHRVFGNFMFDRQLNETERNNLTNGIFPSIAPSRMYLHTNFGDDVSFLNYGSHNRKQTVYTNNGSNAITPDKATLWEKRYNNPIFAYPILYGYTGWGNFKIPYAPTGAKMMSNEASDIEFPASGCIHNLYESRIYFDRLTDATAKAIMDKSNRTYWKASIETQDAYIDAGGGYYGVWTPWQLMRDFIEAHAQVGHANHIFASLRTSNGKVTGITAIRIYKQNQ